MCESYVATKTKLAATTTPNDVDVEALAKVFYKAQERLDPTEGSDWEKLAPLEKEFYRYPVRVLLLEKELLLRALERAEFC
jgi:hypothetical protein